MRTNHPHVMLTLSLWALPFLHVQAVNGRTVEAWRTPVPVSGVNTEYHEKAPFLSFDGKTLYFGRQNATRHNHEEAMRESACSWAGICDRR